MAAFVAALAFTSCHKDPTPEPAPEPQTVTRLASMEVHKSIAMENRIFAYFNWENGDLMSVYDSIVMPIMTTVTNENMLYEGGNLMKVEEESGKWVYSFTYENNQIVDFLCLRNNDTTAWGTVTYNTDGYVEEMMYHNSFITTKWSLTWVNGDATEVVEEIVEPADMAKTTVFTHTYDDKPCIYSGFPMGYIVFDGDGNRVARRLSKHNIIDEGYTYNYDENGLLISVVAENDSTFYQFIEQTVE